MTFSITMFTFLISTYLGGVVTLIKLFMNLNKRVNEKCNRKELEKFKDRLSLDINQLERDMKDIAVSIGENKTNIIAIKENIQMILNTLKN